MVTILVGMGVSVREWKGTPASSPTFHHSIPIRDPCEKCSQPLQTILSELRFVTTPHRNRLHSHLIGAFPTLDNLDTFLRICNPDDRLQVLLMIEAGSDGFASLVMDYAVSKVASR
ncbi:unnamed protein product [Schistocephalus solidus]|uniref:Vps8 domain-containing protein n=1 Tax=Schistocephalus solidus TaxID=70667 RepID=A0A183SAC4_SCHSO|nr:unnamed protein product [Schistocephalus solidus]